MEIHNDEIRRLIRETYRIEEVEAITRLLEDRRTFSFPELANGLFPAANLAEKAAYTGYGNVWVRDNVFVALAHHLNGRDDSAVRTVQTLAHFFTIHRWRLEKIISGELDYHEPMNRPHIRFNGVDLSVLKEKWSHAQNDALGYFVWLFCRLANDRRLTPSQSELHLMALFASYWMTIRYWEDEDSGHWEEKRKIEASSIGVVVGALREMRGLIHGQSHETEGHRPDSESLLELIESLLRRGEACLNDILPDECVQKDEAKRRKFDSALLFLLFPMAVAPAGTADQILANTLAHLKGKFGIKRYLGDSFWAPDYKKRLSPSVRTVDASDAIEARNRLAVPNQEAEWCIFDPIVSVIYGQRFRKSKDKADFKLQCEYFSRSLGQLTEEDNECGGFKCPELYYLESGRYVVNDTVPLLWTQANLWMATKFLSDNALLNDTGRDGAP